jgi:beta-N-acetylhexosaminidase
MKSDLRADCGQMLLVGFDGDALPTRLNRALRDGEVGGVILFGRNIVEPAQVAALNASVYAAAADREPPFIAVDQEGGRVQRLRAPLTVVPPMMQVGATRDTRLARAVGEVLGAELEALGFNLDFAPCVDVLTNPENPVIGDRAFGTDPETVTVMAGAVMLGLIQAGMIPCAKHFPGHGDTRLDSHLDLPVVEHDYGRIERIELEPFRRLIRARVPMIMTAHILVPAVDATLPATLSPTWIAKILRQDLDYAGVVISDDLEMKAVADRYSIEEMIELGVPAGLDIFLVCRSEDMWLEAYELLVRGAERSSTFRDRVELAAGRVRKLKKDYLRPWERPAKLDDLLGTIEHRAIVERVLAYAND